MQPSICPQCRDVLGPSSPGWLRCPRCGYQVAAVTGPLQPFGAPPPMMAAPPPKSSSPIGWILAIAGLVLVLPGCVAAIVLFGSFAAFSSARPSPPPAPVVAPAPTVAPAPEPTPAIAAPEEPTPAPAPAPLHAQSRTCLLNDLDGDGAGEIGVLVSQGRDRRPRPTILDGATGTPRWLGEPLADSRDIRLLCAGPDWLVVLDDARFELRFHPITSPDGVLVRSLTDEVDRFGVTDRCLALRLEDGTRPSFSLETGNEASCSASYGSRPHISDSTTCGIISMNRRGRTVSAGEVSYQIHVRPRGTELLQVTARRRSRELWSRPLDLVPVGGTAIGCFAGAAFPGTAVVLGSERDGSRGTGLFAVGLAEETGEERYRLDLHGGSMGVSVRDVVNNGRFAIVTTSSSMTAIDPTTGEQAWSL
ncbi:MAG: hypothetical protein H6719_22080 [Sandaracinaceae bacterium]|nr:hypothetical protein [Sandaracinaceae bacterium]